MRLYTPYDELHQSLVSYYGSEWKLKFAILKDQKPFQYNMMMTKIWADIRKASNRFNMSILGLSDSASKIKLTIDTKWE